MFRSRLIILALLVILVATRLWRLDQPNTYYFDEVYHAFTATEMSKGDPKAWEWWNQGPEGFAYEWTHPPLAKLAMSAGMSIFGVHSFAWRLPGAIAGIILGLLIYLLSDKLAGRKVAILALLIYTFDGMGLVLSRIGMNDIYLMVFIMLSLVGCIHKRYGLAVVAFGLAIASKWSAIYFLPILLYYLWIGKRWFYLVLVPAIYLLVYLPFFLTGHPWSQFVELQKQMWWYHTGLKATHGYSSPAITWPVMLRPVWTYVQYLTDTRADIYIQGNPVVFWGGIVAVTYALWKRKWTLLLTGYLLFWLPWTISPRIMFLYHYFPSVTFLYILLAATIAEVKNKYMVATIVLGIVAVFIYFFPHWTAIPVSTAWANQYFWLSSWR